MALQQRVELPSKILIPQAYWRAEEYQGNRNTMTVFFRAYRDANAAGDGTPAFADRRVTFQPDLLGANLIQQSYLAAKNLPEFTGSLDV